MHQEQQLTNSSPAMARLAKSTEATPGKIFPILVVLFVIFSLLISTGYAGEAVLTWEPPTTNADETPLTDLAGYKVHYGTSAGTYNSPIDVGNVTTYTVSNLASDVTYYFAVTAYDTSGNESGYSTEVSKTIQVSGDAIPPVISGVSTSSITSTNAIITWATDEPSTSQVEYGITTSYGSSTIPDTPNTMATSHNVTLSGLSAWTTYHFRVKSQDASGNLTISEDFTFTTLVPPDTTPPTGTISINNTATYTSSTSVTLSLSCNDSDTGCSQMQFSNDGTTWSVWEAYNKEKTWTLTTGDGTKTVYAHYKDSAGNISSNYTDTITLDTTPPKISGVSSGNTTDIGITISWTTSEAATTQVEYGTNSLYGSFSALDNRLATSHTVILSSLTPNTVYHFRVLSVDQAGNKGISSEYSFTTLKGTQPDTPAAITNLRIRSGSSTKTSVVLDWTATGADGTVGTASMYDLRISTKRFIEDGITPAGGEINFSKATIVEGLPVPQPAGTPESMQVDNLRPNKIYYFAIKVKDDKGNLSPLSNVTNSDTVPPLPTTALRNGYTMISFPLIPAGSDVQESLGGIVGHPVELYWWSSNGLGEDGIFVKETNIVPGYGYFIKSSKDDAVLNISGTVVTDASRAIPLQPGWNIIGNPYPKEVALIDVYIRKTETGEIKSYEEAVIAGWVGNSIYNYNGSTYDFEFYTDAVLRLWQGFWLAVLQNEQYEMIIYNPSP